MSVLLLLLNNVGVVIYGLTLLARKEPIITGYRSELDRQGN